MIALEAKNVNSERERIGAGTGEISISHGAEQFFMIFFFFFFFCATTPEDRLINNNPRHRGVT